jgi:hypothetical protein
VRQGGGHGFRLYQSSSGQDLEGLQLWAAARASSSSTSPIYSCQHDPQVEPSQESANGRAGPSRKHSIPPSPTDAIHFINHDRAVGKIESIQNGKARLNLAGTVLDIPLERVTQIEFAAAKAPANRPARGRCALIFRAAAAFLFNSKNGMTRRFRAGARFLVPWPSSPAPSAKWSSTSTAPKEDTVVADNKEFEGLDE